MLTVVGANYEQLDDFGLPYGWDTIPRNTDWCWLVKS
jgi:hypothetical protein